MDPHCFFRREQELYGKNYGALKDRFDAQPCSYVKFLHRRKRGEVWVEDGELKDGIVRDWVGRKVEEGVCESRVIFAAPREDFQGSNPAWTPPIPFSQQTFYSILETCSFHRGFFDGRNPAIEKTSIGPTTSIFIAHKLSTCTIRLWLSFHAPSATTNVLLYNYTPVEQKYIRERLEEDCLRPLTLHPFLIPVIVLERVEAVITRQLRTLIERSLAGLEKVGRDLRGYEYLARNNIIETEAKAALELQIYTASIRENIDVAMLTARSLLGWAREIDKSGMQEEQAKRFGDAEELICDRLEYFLRGMEIQMLGLKRAETIINIHRQGLEVQNASIGNKLNVTISQQSRDIARGSKRDSSAMKAIAVLTMFFLPGTFLAALFAAPLFDWGSPEGKIIKTRFWIYWVVTVLATGVVLGLWRAWYRFEEWREGNGEGKSFGREIWRWIMGMRKKEKRGRGRSGDERGDVEMGERWGSWGYEVGKEVS